MTNNEVFVLIGQNALMQHVTLLNSSSDIQRLIFSARCNIYISRLCYDVSVHLSVCLSVCLSVMEVHWRIIANLGFKFRSHFTTHCGHHAAGGQRAARHAACVRIISRHASQC